VKLKFVVALLLPLRGASFFSVGRSPPVVCFSATSTAPASTPNLNRRRSICGVLSPLKNTEEIIEVNDVVKVADVVVDNKRNGKQLPVAAKQRKPVPVKRAKQQPKRNGKVDHRVIVPEMVARGLTNVTNATEDQVKENIRAAEDVMELMGEISERMSLGSKEMLGDLSHVMEEKLVRLPEDKANEFTKYLTELTETIQAAQQRELERQLAEIEARFVKPLEQFVFSDAAIYDGGNSDQPESERRALRSQLVWAGANSTLSASRRLRTKEIIKNINVAPFYYSVALLMRWVRKVGYPPMVLLSAFRSMASVVKFPSIRRKYSNKGDQYQEYLKNAEVMQAGWKRTGEIAARGPMARKWAILRRSAEIWAYFSSFYIKERRFVNKFNKGQWTAEKLSEERSKLGAEITQNLLKLGPTFIKVRLLEEITQRNFFLSKLIC
jgi:hypothetical protein